MAADAAVAHDRIHALLERITVLEGQVTEVKHLVRKEAAELDLPNILRQLILTTLRDVPGTDVPVREKAAALWARVQADWPADQVGNIATRVATFTAERVARILHKAVKDGESAFERPIVSIAIATAMARTLDRPYRQRVLRILAICSAMQATVRDSDERAGDGDERIVDGDERAVDGDERAVDGDERDAFDSYEHAVNVEIAGRKRGRGYRWQPYGTGSRILQ